MEFRPGYRGFLKFAEFVGLDLEGFQRKIARAFFDGQRELLILLPKGNGKTTLMAAVAVHHLATHPNPAVFCGAASVQQARILFEAAREMSRKLPPRERIKSLAIELRAEKTSGVLRMLPADGPRTHGITYSLGLVDELWAHRDSALYESFRSAAIKRSDARLIVISTSDVGEDRPLCRLRTRALALPEVKRTGPLVECKGPNFRALLWEVPDGTGSDDLKAIAAVNPASWITEDLLAEQREVLPEPAFLRYHANARVQKQGAWLPVGAYQEAVGDPQFEPGERIRAALDVGKAESATALVWMSESMQVGSFIVHGEDGILQARDKLAELREEFDLMELAADDWQGVQLMAELEREGVPVVQFAQSDTRMSPASDRLRTAITRKEITLPPDPELARHAANAVMRLNRRGWRIDKPDRSSPVDAMIALAMVVERSTAPAPTPVKLIGWV
jgi:phage terminase large subunit-like protein